MSTKTCPVCGQTIHATDWSDDIAGATTRVETLARCKAGHYEDHYAYGDHTVTVAGQQFDWDYTTPAEEVEAIQGQIQAAVARAKGGAA